MNNYKKEFLDNMSEQYDIFVKFNWWDIKSFNEYRKFWNLIKPREWIQWEPYGVNIVDLIEDHKKIIDTLKKDRINLKQFLNQIENENT